MFLQNSVFAQHLCHKHFSLETYTKHTQATTHHLYSCAPNSQPPAVCKVTNEHCHFAKHQLALLLQLCTVVQCFVFLSEMLKITHCLPNSHTPNKDKNTNFTLCGTKNGFILNNSRMLYHCYGNVNAATIKYIWLEKWLKKPVTLCPSRHPVLYFFWGPLGESLGELVSLCISQPVSSFYSILSDRIQSYFITCYIRPEIT